MVMDARKHRILEIALDALHRHTGLQGTVVDQEPPAGEGMQPDALIDFEASGRRYPYAVLIKHIDRFAALGDIRKRLPPDTATPPLLVAPRLTPEAVEKCRELDLQCIDAAGNAYLRGTGLHVLVKGQRPAQEDNLLLPGQEANRAGTATHLRVVFVLLCQPALLNAPYRDIARAAGVALGNIGMALKDLAARGLIAGGRRKAQRVMLERDRLTDEWVTTYPIRLRPKLNTRRFKAPAPQWWQTVDLAQYDAQWGAEVAAAKLTGHLRPDTVTIYLHRNNGKTKLTELVAEHRLRPAPDGNIEVLDAFWAFDDDRAITTTVPPLLAYADLIATFDPRNLEAATLIHDQYLDTAGSTA